MMPTDIPLTRRREAPPEPHVAKSAFTDLTTLCFWTVVAWALVTLLLDTHMDPDIIATMVIPG